MVGGLVSGRVIGRPEKGCGLDLPQKQKTWSIGETHLLRKYLSLSRSSDTRGKTLSTHMKRDLHPLECFNIGS